MFDKTIKYDGTNMMDIILFFGECLETTGLCPNNLSLTLYTTKQTLAVRVGNSIAKHKDTFYVY